MLANSALKPHLVYDELRKCKILIRDVSGYPMLGNYFRVSVGTPHENDLLLAALQQICA